MILSTYEAAPLIYVLLPLLFIYVWAVGVAGTNEADQARRWATEYAPVITEPLSTDVRVSFNKLRQHFIDQLKHDSHAYKSAFDSTRAATTSYWCHTRRRQAA